MTDEQNHATKLRAGTDPVFWLALGLMATWHLWVWHDIWGARIADTVEYLDRALTAARGIELGSATSRAPLYSLMLVPLVKLLDLLGLDALEDFTRLARALSTLFCFLAAQRLYLLAAILGGRRAARGAVLLLAGSITWAAWGPEPISAPAACFFLLWGAQQHCSARSLPAMVRAAALLGLAVAVKYQLVAVAPLVLLLPTRGALGLRARGVALLAVAAVALACACGADLTLYGSPAQTWPSYLRANVAPLLYSILHPLLPTELRLLLHRSLFDLPAAEQITSGLALQRAQPFGWYVLNPQEWLGAPFLALLCGAALAVVLSRRRGPTLPAITALLILLAVNLLALSLKGSKEARLLLPLIPFVCLVAALALQPLCQRRIPRAGVAALVLACALWPAWELARRSGCCDLGRLQVHWSYAEAMRWLHRIGPRPHQPPWEVVASYHFAIALEERPGLHVVKSPLDLDRFQASSAARQATVERLFEPRSVVHITPPHGAAGAERQDRARRLSRHLGGHGVRAVRGYDGRQVLELDAAHERLAELKRGLLELGFEVRYCGVSSPEWLLTHSQTLTEQPQLMRLCAHHFELAAVFYDPLRAAGAGLHPLWALRRKGMEPSAIPLLRRLEDLPIDVYLEQVESPLRVAFRSAGEPLFELVAVRVHPRFAANGYALVTFCWHALRSLENSHWIFAHRLTGPRAPAVQIDAPPAYGACPTATWRAGAIIEETLLFPLPREWCATSPACRFAIWIGIYDENTPSLHPVQPSNRLGFLPSPDSLIRVGGGIAGPRRDRSVPRTPRLF